MFDPPARLSEARPVPVTWIWPGRHRPIGTLLRPQRNPDHRQSRTVAFSMQPSCVLRAIADALNSGDAAPLLNLSKSGREGQLTNSETCSACGGDIR